jgi:pimeloyl-ACP methyl ester carboxylesterase
MLAIANEYVRYGRKVVALDLPGQGESTPFPPNRPNTLDEYVRALLVLLDQLGIATVDIHAEFTGASLAFALAAQHPARVRGIVADGVPLLGKRAQARLLKQYCPPLKVQADGSHLTSLWQRLRDQELTWPWYERSATGVRKVDADLSGQRLHDLTLELAKQLPHYGDAALAALATNLEALLPQINTPTLLLSDAADPRHASDRTMQRRLSSARMTKRLADAAQRVTTAVEFFARVSRS